MILFLWYNNIINLQHYVLQKVSPCIEFVQTVVFKERLFETFEFAQAVLNFTTDNEGENKTWAHISLYTVFTCFW